MNAFSYEIWDTAACVANADRLASFFTTVFDDGDWSNYAEKLEGRRRLSAVVALDDSGSLAAVKLGYERNRGTFNSWMGGVGQAFRGQGLAQTLMAKQHDWAKSQGFEGVETATRQTNQAMGIINLKSGFVVAGLDVVPGKEIKIIFYKTL
jgi:hypothetical protein